MKYHMDPDKPPSVKLEPLAPIELRMKVHWERFCPKAVAALRQHGGDAELDRAVRAAWWRAEYLTLLAQAQNPNLPRALAQEFGRDLLWPPPETSATPAFARQTTH